MLVVGGRRTVWIGGVTGVGVGPKDGTPLSIYDGANWDNGVPGPGDTLVFTNSTSWNKQVFVGPYGESFDIGAKGIMIECRGDNTKTKFGLRFTGSGELRRSVLVGSDALFLRRTRVGRLFGRDFSNPLPRSSSERRRSNSARPGRVCRRLFLAHGIMQFRIVSSSRGMSRRTTCLTISVRCSVSPER